MKRCQECREWKSPLDFYKTKNTRESVCKECRRARRRAQYAELQRGFRISGESRARWAYAGADVWLTNPHKVRVMIKGKLVNSPQAKAWWHHVVEASSKKVRKSERDGHGTFVWSF